MNNVSISPTTPHSAAFDKITMVWRESKHFSSLKILILKRKMMKNLYKWRIRCDSLEKNSFYSVSMVHSGNTGDYFGRLAFIVYIDTNTCAEALTQPFTHDCRLAENIHDTYICIHIKHICTNFSGWKISRQKKAKAKKIANNNKEKKVVIILLDNSMN